MCFSNTPAHIHGVKIKFNIYIVYRKQIHIYIYIYINIYIPIYIHIQIYRIQGAKKDVAILELRSEAAELVSTS